MCKSASLRSGGRGGPRRTNDIVLHRELSFNKLEKQQRILMSSCHAGVNATRLCGAGRRSGLHTTCMAVRQIEDYCAATPPSELPGAINGSAGPHQTWRVPTSCGSHRYTYRFILRSKAETSPRERRAQRTRLHKYPSPNLKPQT